MDLGGFSRRIPIDKTEARKLDFGFSEEQEMLRDAAKRFLADNCPTKFVRQMMADPTAHDATFWKKLVDLGWPGLLIPESYGGQGGSFLDMTVIVEEAGKALVPGPLFTSALLAAPLLIEGGSDQQKKDILPRMAKGEFIGTVAIAEAAGRFDAEGIQLKATKAGNEYTITGEKFFVPDAHVANGMAVAVRTGGSGEKGISILAMNAKTPGITITQLKTVDMTRRLCHVKFDNVKTSELVGKEGEGWPILRRTLDIATAGLAAEMVGTAQRASDMAKNVTSEAIQVHGGIGFTWEHDMHLFHRRALAGEANLGNAPVHRETVAKSLLG